MTSHHTQHTRLPQLDWLRGSAALAVVAFHYLHKGPAEGWMDAPRLPWLADVAQYGYLGVHLFFMISGYVILMTAQTGAVREFMASRVARLAPALWLCVLLTASIEWLIPQSPFRPEGWGQILANLTLVPHVFGQAPIDGAYWSLAVEVTFYMWMALLLAFGQLKRIEWFIVGWLILSCVNAIRPMYPLQLYVAAQWAPLFSAGAVYFLIRQGGRSARRDLILLACLLLACYYAWEEAGPMRGATAWLAFDQGVNHLVVIGLIVSFFMCFWWLVHDQTVRPPSRASNLAGQLTYPLYLIHQNAGYALFNLAAASGWVGWLTPHGSLASLVLLMIVLAWLIVAGVERPLAGRLRLMIRGRPLRVPG